MLVFAVPGLLLVVVGYAVGYVVVEWLIDATGAQLPAWTPEVAGWITGVLLMAGVTAGAVVRWRRLRRTADRGDRGGHQK